MSSPSFNDVPAWAERLGQVRDVIRQHLVTSQLLEHLPAPAQGQIVVDVGCGQGTQLIALAEQGYEVIGVDPSEKLLEIARQSLADQPDEVQSRVQLREGRLESLDEVVADPVNVLLCHGVLMYLSSLRDSFATLCQQLAKGGILSVLTRNQAGIAMRAGMEGRWEDTISGFDQSFYTNNLGIERVRADLPEDVIGECKAQGLDVLAWYGVRLFTDHWKADDRFADLDQLLIAEEQAGQRDPYRRLAALTHVIAQRP